MAKSRRVKAYLDKQNEKEPSPLRKRRGLLFFLGFLAFLTFFAGLTLGGYNFLKYRFVKDGPLTQQAVFEVPRGSGISAIAAKLEREEIIDSARMFKIMVKVERDDRTLKAGEYAIPAESSLSDVFEILAEGQAILYPFTVAEGLTSAQIMRMMDNMPTLVDDDPAIPAEGSLLPETYLTPRGMTQSELIAKMQAAHTEVLDTLWENRAEGLPISSKYEATILASVVEKETGIAAERDKVAGVFINRLNRGMRLQSDPTIIYGITKGEPLGRGIRRSEIDGVTEWNTYQIDGLPITPICNPGRESLAAVLNPAKTSALYFVADGTGGHVFADTHREHINNVNNWRAIERQRKSQ